MVPLSGGWTELWSMPGKNKTPLLGWHAPAELQAWVRGEAERRGLPIAAILNQCVAVAMYIQECERAKTGQAGH